MAGIIPQLRLRYSPSPLKALRNVFQIQGSAFIFSITDERDIDVSMLMLVNAFTTIRPTETEITGPLVYISYSNYLE